MGLYSIEGPDSQMLTAAEVVAYLRLESDRALRRLVADGKFPRPIKHGPQSKPVWSAVDVACYVHLSSRMRPSKRQKKAPARPPEKKS